MAGTMTTQSVEDAVLGYIGERYQRADCLDVSVLKLDESWLVQASLDSSSGIEPPERLVLLVNAGGSVQEVGGSATRQSAQRCLAGLKSSARSEAHR